MIYIILWVADFLYLQHTQSIRNAEGDQRTY